MKNKESYQKRGLAINRLIRYFEEFQEISLAELMCVLVSPIGEDKHPRNWDDNQLIGKIEKNTEILSQEYKLESED